MRRTPIFVLALTAVMIPAIQQVHAASHPLEGVISDTMCGKKHMLPGKTDAECIQECIKGKSSYALVVGDKVYTLAGKAETIAPFAGKHVKVEGSVKGSTITVTAVHEAKAGMPDMPGMPM
ncbi:MAG: hypothetical protein JST28_19470 [Acidobacteria bacterium]|nr:hypothetical protein [Acidobacteriota bacterium]